jgi:hypothetical protein
LTLAKFLFSKVFFLLTKTNFLANIFCDKFVLEPNKLIANLKKMPFYIGAPEGELGSLQGRPRHF